MTQYRSAGTWEMPAWKVAGTRGAAAALALIGLAGILSLVSHGKFMLALIALAFFVAIAGLACGFAWTSVTRLRWMGSDLAWNGMLGNSGVVAADEIVIVTTSAMRPSRTVIKLKHGSSLMVGGWVFKEILGFIYAEPPSASGWSANESAQAAPGWYPDPSDPAFEWYWDGNTYTSRRDKRAQ